MNSDPQEWAMIVARCLVTPIAWEDTRNPEFPYRSFIAGRWWVMRINDFPAEPLYTLMIEGQEALDLEDWPAIWKKPPSHPL
jgi:hypothetical protein